jgi:hypothetical protein
MIMNMAVFLPTYIDGRNTLNDWNSSDHLDAQDISFIIAIFQIA